MRKGKMSNVSIKMSPEEIAYIGRQEPNRSEFVRRLIHQHKDMQTLADGLKAGRQREEAERDGKA